MNKVTLIICLIFSSILYAKPIKESAVIVLQLISPNGKVASTETVVVQEKQLIVNGESLSHNEILLKLPIVKKIMGLGEKNPSTTCLGGTYKHIIKIGIKKEQIESGCLGSTRHIFLKNSFRQLKKSSLLKS